MDWRRTESESDIYGDILIPCVLPPPQNLMPTLPTIQHDCHKGVAFLSDAVEHKYKVAKKVFQLRSHVQYSTFADIWLGIILTTCALWLLDLSQVYSVVSGWMLSEQDVSWSADWPTVHISVSLLCRDRSHRPRGCWEISVTDCGINRNKTLLNIFTLPKLIYSQHSDKWRLSISE